MHTPYSYYSTRYYSTRDMAVQYEIVDPIEGDAPEFEAYETHDVEAIADKVIRRNESGYFCKVDPDTFWAIVEKHEWPTAALNHDQLWALLAKAALIGRDECQGMEKFGTVSNHIRTRMAGTFGRLFPEGGNS